MKRLISNIIILIIVTLSFVFPKENIKIFSVKDYEHELNTFNSNQIQNFPRDQYGYIPDKKTAIEVAEKVWRRIVGEEDAKIHKPYIVYYDEDSDIWLVEGFFGKNWGPGGVPYVLIQKADGKILAVWHDK